MAYKETVVLELKGDKALIAAFDSMSGGAARKIMRPAARAAMKPVVARARQLAPKRAPIPGYAGGQLKKSIGTTDRTYPSKGVVWVGVGPRAGFRITIPRWGSKHHGIDQVMPINPVKYAHLVEFGTKRQAAQSFLRRAFDETKGDAMGILRYRCWAGILTRLHNIRKSEAA